MSDDLAKTLLEPHGIWGNLRQVNTTNWQYVGTKGKQGVAVDIEGEPDEAILREAAGKIVEGLSAS